MIGSAPKDESMKPIDVDVDDEVLQGFLELCRRESDDGRQLSMESLMSMLQLVDKFDCRAFLQPLATKLSKLPQSDLDSVDAWQLFILASKVRSTDIAKIAIGQMRSFIELDEFDHHSSHQDQPNKNDYLTEKVFQHDIAPEYRLAFLRAVSKTWQDEAYDLKFHQAQSRSRSPGRVEIIAASVARYFYIG